MKKIIAIVLAMMTVFSYATVAFAESTTTLTTTVPDAEYTLNIPEDKEITFGLTATNIGTVTVTDSSGFAAGKDLKVTLQYDSLKSEDVTTEIPYSLHALVRLENDDEKFAAWGLDNGSSLTFLGKADGKCSQDFRAEGAHYVNYSSNRPNSWLEFRVLSSDWGKALAGDYSTTITFTAEVVAETPTT